MATLHFKGKSAVWNHHLSVPYHALEKDEEDSLKGTNADENLIIEGDNLLALKSLLPQYQGRIKCIYIDPPYNTGNGWTYNDKVNSPTIKDWIGKAVGQDDLSRHDKWLCMMTPRLKLLQELLAEDGVILVSIDDTEQGRLRSLMDEIFREENFIAQFVWTTKTAPKGVPTNKMIVSNHEYIIAYQKTNGFAFRGNKRDVEKFTNPDNDPRGEWKADNMKSTVATAKEFTIVDPATGHKFTKKWAFSKATVKQMIEEGKVLFPKDPSGTPRQKRFLSDYTNETTPLVSQLGTFHTETATNKLKELFDGEKVFDFPKPVELIQILIQQVSSGNDIVLDSFAGSGTTAQAVLDANAKDGESRKFILVQLREEVKEGTPAYKLGFRWVRELTRERVKRVIEKNKYKDGFTYATLGPAIDAETLLTGNLPTYKELAKYVYYLAMGKNHPNEKEIKEDDGFVGKAERESVYLLYKQDMDALKKLAITLDWAQETHKKDSDRKIVYAPACYLDDEMLEEFNIKFVSIPYNLFERTA